MQLSIVASLLIGIPLTLATFSVLQHGIVYATLISFIVYYCSMGMSVVAYRLSPIHPLAQYPGPVLAKISAFWMAWVASHGKRHVYIERLHLEYGDIVRIGVFILTANSGHGLMCLISIGPNELSIKDASAIFPLMGSNGMPKGPGMVGRVQHQQSSLITYQDPIEHARRRRPWNRAFNTHSLKEYQPIIARRAVQLVEALQSQSGSVDLAQWISFFTYVFHVLYRALNEILNRLNTRRYDFMGDMA